MIKSIMFVGLLFVAVSAEYKPIFGNGPLFGQGQTQRKELTFCQGWKAGYKAGYCYQKFGCIEPIVPLCPMEKLNEKTYRDGYNRGFLVGLSKKN